jgi:hypothetical protein
VVEVGGNEVMGGVELGEEVEKGEGVGAAGEGDDDGSSG